MKAIVVHEYGGPEVMRLEDVPDPRPGPSEILVRICAAGVNPVDAYIRMGTYARKPKLPYIPGSDGAGVVEAVGSSVDGFKPGDRVYIAQDNQSTEENGTYAELAVCRPAMLHRLTDRMTFGQGAAVGVPYTTAYRALFLRGNARPAETVLVHGATGGVGIAAVEMAHAHGMMVIGTGGTERGLQTARDHGADVVVNHRDANYMDAVMEATGGRGVDLILEMAAHINLDRDLEALARFGRVVVIGSRGRIEIDPRQTMRRDGSILGLTLFNATISELTMIHAALVAGFAAGTLSPVVGREMPLGDVIAAHNAVMEPGAHGKIVLIP